MIATNINLINNQQEEEYVINNGRRYEVSIPNYFKQQNYIVYEAKVFDSAFNRSYALYFRFKALKKLHQQMLKHTDPDNIPEFPKTKSFGIWNKTNSDPKMIQERIRDLQYYLVKLLNNGHIQKLQEIAYIRKSIRNNQLKRSFSLRQKRQKSQSDAARWNQCPQFYKKKMLVGNLL